jgi:hypothetical protein
MAYKRRIGKIKVDFFNMRVEFSPNIEIISKKAENISGGSDKEEVTISFEIMGNITPNTKPEYKTYILSQDDIADDEPFDLKNPWYKLEGLEQQIAKQDALPDGEAVSTPAPKPVSDVAAVMKPKPTPITTKSPEDMRKIQDLEKQISSLQNMISNLDSGFTSGNITQEEYLRKKNFLGEKLGTLMGQIDQLK